MWKTLIKGREVNLDLKRFTEVVKKSNRLNALLSQTFELERARMELSRSMVEGRTSSSTNNELFGHHNNSNNLTFNFEIQHLTMEDEAITCVTCDSAVNPGGVFVRNNQQLNEKICQNCASILLTQYYETNVNKVPPFMLLDERK